MNRILRHLLVLLLTLSAPAAAFAQADAAAGASTPAANAVATAPPDAMSNPIFWLLIALIVVLMFIIIGMSNMVSAAAVRELRKQMNSKKNAAGVIILLLMLPLTTFAQQAKEAYVVPVFRNDYGGLSAGLFWLLVGIIVIELIVILVLFRRGSSLLGADENLAALQAQRREAWGRWMERANSAVAVEEEGTIMFDHEYDGIRELDNSLPPWWKYGFYITIVFSLIYVVHFHMLGTGMLSAAEYDAQMKEGERQKAEFRAKAGSLLDENNVYRVMGADSLATGAKLYGENCKACHGDKGQGGIGPNLTDDYWLHGGDVKSIFKTVKYGVAGKQMQPWEASLRPVEMAEVVGYLMSLRGTNPPGALGPDGDLYVPEGEKPITATGGDSLSKDSANSKDSAKTTPVNAGAKPKEK